MSEWTMQRVEQLAPDSASLKAAQGTAKPAKWQNLGASGTLLWGECQGSGANPYQVRADLAELGWKCSCPSRKQPCKHTLALLLMLAGGTKFAGTTAPGFVEEWAANRQKRTEAKQARADEAESKAPDPLARSKRIEKRESRIEAGLEQLEAWIADLVGQGLASARTQGPAYWSKMAAWLVDAQAPGLARRVRELGERAVSSQHWQSEMLAALARLQLAIDAYRGIERLPPDLAADLRTLVGWTQDQEELRAREGMRDVWQVIGLRQAQEEQLRVQHVWLHGERSGRIALSLEFAVGTQPLPAHAIGQVLDAELVFFDGCPPQRALIKQRIGALPSRFSLPLPLDVDALQQFHAQRLVANPWLERVPAVLGPVRPQIAGERLLLVDPQQRAVSLSPACRHRWNLVALACGGELTLFGEWDGQCFDPCTVEHAGALYAIAQHGDLPVLGRLA